MQTTKTNFLKLIKTAPLAAVFFVLITPFFANAQVIGESLAAQQPAVLPGGTQVQMMQMEEEIRNLRGKVEELEYTNRALLSRFDKLSSDVDFRLKEIEKGGGSKPAAEEKRDAAPDTEKKRMSKILLPAEKADAERNAALESLKAEIDKEAAKIEKSIDRTPDSMREPAAPGSERVLGTIKIDKADGSVKGTSVGDAMPNPLETEKIGEPEKKPEAPKPVTARDKYNDAFSDLSSGNFDAATLKFEKFVGEFPKDSFSGLALFWLGEIYSTKGDYERAAKRYLSSYKDFPKGQRAPDSLLKLASTLGRLDKKKEACTTLSKLEKEFPKAGQNIKTAAEQEKKKLACS